MACSILADNFFLKKEKQKKIFKTNCVKLMVC